MNWPDSPTGGVLGDGRFAHATDRPDSLDALRGMVADRVSQGHAIYPQGGQTSLDFGGIPRAPGVAVNVQGLARVIDYPAADMTVTVEAGITLASLQAVLAEQGQRLLIDAPGRDRATLGGIYATNASGPRRFGAGRPRDQILGVSYVNGDGDLVKGGGRVVKNVAGYDLPRLLTGSMGTLGILAQLTLKVRPRPESSAIAWVRFDQSSALAESLDRLNTSATRPIAVEVFNRSGARIVGATSEVEAGEWNLAVGFEDNADSVAWQLDRLRGEVPDSSAFDVREGDAAAPLWDSMTEFPPHEGGAVSFTANLLPSQVMDFMEGLAPERWAVQSHAGNGIVRTHFLGEPELDSIAGEVDPLRAKAVRLGGNLTISRCPTAWKPRLRVWGEPRGDWALCERIKQALDPRGVMNPGRFIGAI